MATDVQAVLDLLVRHGYLLVFIAGLAEALPLLGVLIPGQAIILVAGALAATGRLSLPLIILAALPAGILGDAIGYYTGRRLGRPLLEKYGARLRITDKHLGKSDALFAKYGVFALVLGRFSFLTRGLVPLLAGMSKLRQRTFWPVNVLGAIAWSVGFAVTGYAFGFSFLYVEGRVGRILAVTLLTALGVYLLYRAMKKYAPQLTRDDLGLVVTTIAGAVTFGILTDRVARLGGENRLDASLSAYVEAFAPAAPLLDLIGAATGLLVVGSVALVLLAVLAARRLAWEAGLVGVGVGGVLLLVALVRSLLGAPDGHAGYPSGHAASTVVLGGIVTFLVASHARSVARILSVALASAVLVVLATHALIGAGERPTDALGGLALGAAWLGFAILLVEFGVKRERPDARA